MPSNDGTVALTFIVLTKNEEKNLSACLESVHGWVRDIFVVDSGSTDSTLAIAERYEATVVNHAFESHAKQWNWALHNLPISTDWVLGLDADQRVTPELHKEIVGFIDSGRGRDETIAGCFIKRRQIFRGKWIKHGGYYPKYLLKMFRLSKVWVDENDLVDHHFRVNGKTLNLENDINEDNQNEADISVWIEKHNRYAALQAMEENSHPLDRRVGQVKASLAGNPDEKVAWMKRLWGRLPLFVRPFIYFFHRYFIRLGFLDGKEGFIFHFLQGFWYRLLVDIKLDELRKLKPIELDHIETQPQTEHISNKV